MEDTPVTTLTVVKRNPGHRWKPGHPKYGGRRKRQDGVLPSVIATCLERSLNPAHAAAEIFRTGKLKDPDGKTHEVDTRTRIKILMRLMEFTHPRPPVTSLVASEVDHKHLHVDLSRLMGDPVIAAKMEDIALALLDAPDYDTQR